MIISDKLRHVYSVYLNLRNVYKEMLKVIRMEIHFIVAPWLSLGIPNVMNPTQAGSGTIGL